MFVAAETVVASQNMLLSRNLAGVGMRTFVWPQPIAMHSNLKLEFACTRGRVFHGILAVSRNPLG